MGINYFNSGMDHLPYFFCAVCAVKKYKPLIKSHG